MTADFRGLLGIAGRDVDHAHVHGASSELLAAIEKKGDRSVVDELDAHVGLKAASGHDDPTLYQVCDVGFIEQLGQLRRRRLAKAWAPAFSTVTVQGELAHDQNLASAFEDRAVHATLIVLESAKMDCLFSQIA